MLAAFTTKSLQVMVMVSPACSIKARLGVDKGHQRVLLVVHAQGLHRLEGIGVYCIVTPGWNRGSAPPTSQIPPPPRAGSPPLRPSSRLPPPHTPLPARSPGQRTTGHAIARGIGGARCRSAARAGGLALWHRRGWRLPARRLSAGKAC